MRGFLVWVNRLIHCALNNPNVAHPSSGGPLHPRKVTILSTGVTIHKAKFPLLSSKIVLSVRLRVILVGGP
jgi:hypothetical protein